MVSKKVSFTVPCILEAGDYHEFSEMENFLKSQLKIKNLKIVELGLVDRDYIGILYDKDCSPSFEEVSTLLKKEVYGFELDKSTWNELLREN